jgi:large subunit ribosomal protein L29
MKADKIRDLDTAELSVKARDIDEQMFRLKFQLSLGQNDGVKKLRVLRKDRARMLTVLRQRALAGETIAPVAAKADKGKAKKGK